MVEGVVRINFRLSILLTYLSLISLFAVLFITDYLEIGPVYMPVHAQDNHAYFPDYLLSNGSEAINPDSNRSIDSESALPPPYFESQGTDCISTSLQNTNECFVTYVNSTYGIKINYPNTWNKVTPYSDENYTTVFVEEFDKPDSSVYVILGADYFNFEATPSTYLARLIQNYRTQLRDFTLISSNLNSIQLAGIPGYEILYTFTGDNDEVILTRQLGAVIPGTATAYQITYSAEVSEFPGSEDTANKMIDSIELHLNDANVTAPRNLQDLDYFLAVYDGGVI
jgi:hypothetical protein